MGRDAAARGARYEDGFTCGRGYFGGEWTLQILQALCERLGIGQPAEAVHRAAELELDVSGSVFYIVDEALT